MIKKILIANRGEIAVRIVRACAEMGIRSVAVYSEADRHALHVKRADEAHSIGADPLAGYLNPRALVNLAVESGCDALHPGYGFLSENAELAEICAERGIKFIGPSAQVIRRMGDKTEARRSMIAAGVPCTPGTEGNVADLAEALREAERIGYPVMLKRHRPAAASRHPSLQQPRGAGTGVPAGDLRGDQGLRQRRGIPREVHRQSQAHRGADPRRFLRQHRAPVRARLLDPAPQPEAHRDRPEPAAHPRAARLYRRPGGARGQGGGLRERRHRGVPARRRRGVLHGDDTRVQVEHTITEEITGIDVVREQIRIASGLELSVKQDDIVHRGYALQFRINAEDPKNNFLPSFGKITRYYAPGGPGVRTDTAIYTGYTIPPYYDSMCLKLIVWALTWEEALDRGLRALDDMRVQGVKTTAPYYQEILRNPEFRSGQFNTSFVESHPELTQYSIKRNPSHLAIAIATAIAAHAGL